MARKTVTVNYLARVEGEGALHVSIRDGQAENVELRIFEPPRFFEALLRGRAYTEAHDITSRICGICPVAYQMSTVHAIEHALGVTIDEPIRQLRRLLYCGEWIESHALHVFMLHAPDFLGYQSAIDMAKDHGDLVRKGLEIKKYGNLIVQLLGGREIHPINVRVGGFYRAPTRRELLTLVEPLQRWRDVAIETARAIAKFEFHDCERDYHFVALRHPTDYPFSEGRLVSNRGLDISAQDYEQHFQEVHVPYSTALQSRMISADAHVGSDSGRSAGRRLHQVDIGKMHPGGQSYFVGPMARYNLNFDRLSPLAQETARAVGLGPVCTNPYKSILIRAVEIVYAYDEALRIIAAYEPPSQAAVPAPPRAGEGCAITEAPRGILYHRYEVAADGTILDARIIPPTSQNQSTIEQDLREFVGAWTSLDDEALRWRCEQTVRNYDPCISCSTHFLKLTVDRR